MSLLEVPWLRMESGSMYHIFSRRHYDISWGLHVRCSLEPRVRSRGRISEFILHQQLPLPSPPATTTTTPRKSEDQRNRTWAKSVAGFGLRFRVRFASPALYWVFSDFPSALV